MRIAREGVRRRRREGRRWSAGEGGVGERGSGGGLALTAKGRVTRSKGWSTAVKGAGLRVERGEGRRSGAKSSLILGQRVLGSLAFALRRTSVFGPEVGERRGDGSRKVVVGDALQRVLLLDGAEADRSRVDGSIREWYRPDRGCGWVEDREGKGRLARPRGRRRRQNWVLRVEGGRGRSVLQECRESVSDRRRRLEGETLTLVGTPARSAPGAASDSLGPMLTTSPPSSLVTIKLRSSGDGLTPSAER